MAPEAVKLSFTLRGTAAIDMTNANLRAEIVKIIENTVENMARKLAAHLASPNASAFEPFVGGSISGSNWGSLSSDVLAHVVANLPKLITNGTIHEVNGDVVIKPRPEVDLSLVALANALAEYFATEFDAQYNRARASASPILQCSEAHAVVKPTLDRYLPKKTLNGIQIMTPSSFNSNTSFFADKSQLPLALTQQEGVRYYVDPNHDEEFDFTNGALKWNDHVRGVAVEDPNDKTLEWIKVELEAVQGLKAWLEELNIQTKHDDALNYLTCEGADNIQDAFDFGVQARESFFAALNLTEIEEARVRAWVKNKFQVAPALPIYDANARYDKAALAGVAWKRAQQAKIAWESANKKQRFGP